MPNLMGQFFHPLLQQKPSWSGAVQAASKPFQALTGAARALPQLPSAGPSDYLGHIVGAAQNQLKNPAQFAQFASAAAPGLTKGLLQTTGPFGILAAHGLITGGMGGLQDLRNAFGGPRMPAQSPMQNAWAQGKQLIKGQY